jgi:hypothetical protein
MYEPVRGRSRNEYTLATASYRITSASSLDDAYDLLGGG